MHPELFTLPGGITIQTYGFFLMVGFLSGVWLAMRRASRVRANPDVVLDLSFVALLAGVAGARLFYVIHYWKTQFANAPNKLLAIVDIRQGGLEFLGGLLAASIAVVIYMRRKRHPIRMYLDILAPSAMWGAAFGRIGCFFNGCCFGATAIAGGGQELFPWTVQFPYGSPAQIHQWEERQVTIPAELTITAPGALQPGLVPAAELSMSVEQREGPARAVENLKREYERARDTAPEGAETQALKRRYEAAAKALDDEDDRLKLLRAAQKYPSRRVPERASSVSELQELAARCQSLPVHPVQLYSATSAMILSLVLSALFYWRKRHGVVAGMLFVLYPMARVMEEMIRADNPRDTAGLTISQFISLSMMALGLAYMFVLFTRLPERAPTVPTAST